MRYREAFTQLATLYQEATEEVVASCLNRAIRELSLLKMFEKDVQDVSIKTLDKTSLHHFISAESLPKFKEVLGVSGLSNNRLLRKLTEVNDIMSLSYKGELTGVYYETASGINVTLYSQDAGIKLLLWLCPKQGSDCWQLDSFYELILVRAEALLSYYCKRDDAQDRLSDSISLYKEIKNSLG